MFNPFENMRAFMQQFQLFQQQMQGKGNPQQLVQNMLNTGADVPGSVQSASHDGESDHW